MWHAAWVYNLQDHTELNRRATLPSSEPDYDSQTSGMFERAHKFLTSYSVLGII